MDQSTSFTTKQTFNSSTSYVLPVIQTLILEDHLDLGVLYCANAQHRREYICSSLFLSVGMAHKLGYPALASALAFQETLSVELPAKICRAQGHSFILAQA